MAGGIRALAGGAAVALISGCVSGHLVDAARRWERPATFEEVRVDGARAVVRYVAAISDDAGDSVGERRRRAFVALPPSPAAETPAEFVRPTFVADEGPVPGVPVPFAVEGGGDGGPRVLVIGDPATPIARLPENGFTAIQTAAWVYPLLPAALVIDATSLPVLLLFAPAPMAIGD